MIGVKGLGTRFNVLMTVQVPLKQQEPQPCDYEPQPCDYDPWEPNPGHGLGMPGGGWDSRWFLLGGDCPMSAAAMEFEEVHLSPPSSGDLSALGCASDCGANDGGAKAAVAFEYAKAAVAFECAVVDEHHEAAFGCAMVDEHEEEALCVPQGVQPFAFECPTRLPERSPPARPKVGQACAARVSRGSEVDVWPGLTVREPRRHEAEHVTCTVVIYNAVAGGVPSEEDVVRAVEDLERLYASCGASGRLTDREFDFMKAELTVKDAVDIKTKLATQPYKPPGQPVKGFDVFPTEEEAPPPKPRAGGLGLPATGSAAAPA